MAPGLTSKENTVTSFIFGGPPDPETQAMMEAERQRQLGAIHANLAPLDAFIERATLEELTMLRNVVSTIIHNPDSGHFLSGRLAERARGKYNICTFCNEKHETPEDFLAAHGGDGGVKIPHSDTFTSKSDLVAEALKVIPLDEIDHEAMAEMTSMEYRTAMDGLPEDPDALTDEEKAKWDRSIQEPMPDHEDDVDPPTTDGTY